MGNETLHDSKNMGPQAWDDKESVQTKTTAIPFQLYVCPAVLLRKPIHDSKPESPAATACKI